MSALETEDDEESETDTDEAEVASLEIAKKLGRRMSDAMKSSPMDTEPGQPPSKGEGDTTHFASPGDLAAQLYANPKLAALRGMAMSPLQTSNIKPSTVTSPPILANPKCSGYFVEPVSVSSICFSKPYVDSDLDGLDGTIFGRGRAGWKDHMPE